MGLLQIVLIFLLTENTWLEFWDSHVKCISGTKYNRAQLQDSSSPKCVLLRLLSCLSKIKCICIVFVTTNDENR